MGGEQKSICCDEYAMASGDGPLSYTRNSVYQRLVADAAKLLIREAIEKTLDIQEIFGTGGGHDTFCIADFGCSTGPNTFFAVQNILESVKQKYYEHHMKIKNNPEFHVIFNDHVSNDFNTLFRSLPPNKQYYASGVPGSFHGRLLPGASLHFVHSSYSLHWLSKVPEELTDRDSPAWNKGRIHYATAGREVIEAYRKQHARDMECFLEARAMEVVPGGLMVIVLGGRPDGQTTHAQVNFNLMFDLLGSCLVDLANQGKIDEEEVNSINLPIYFVSAREMEEIIRKNGKFSIERMEGLPATAIPPLEASELIRKASWHIRAITEEVITKNIGSHILHHLFDLYEHKLSSAPKFPLAKELNLFLLLKRRPST